MRIDDWITEGREKMRDFVMNPNFNWYDILKEAVWKIVETKKWGVVDRSILTAGHYASSATAGPSAKITARRCVKNMFLGDVCLFRFTAGDHQIHLPAALDRPLKLPTTQKYDAEFEITLMVRIIRPKCFIYSPYHIIRDVSLERWKNDVRWK